MSLYEYERMKTALAEEKRKNAELARRIENTEEAKLNSLHDLIDRLPGALSREESREDEDDGGRTFAPIWRRSTEERVRGAIEYVKRRDEALKEITKIIAPEDAIVGEGDHLVAPTISRIPTPQEIQDFERRTKAEIAAVRRQSRVDQAELAKVQTALMATGMPAGVTYRTWIAELQRKIDSAQVEAAKSKKTLDDLYAEEQRFQRERIAAESAPDIAKAKHDMEQIVKLLAQHGIREPRPLEVVHELLRAVKSTTKFKARVVCAIQPHGIVSSEASNDHAENEYLATDFMSEDQIVAWIKDAKKTIDSAPPANTAREDRSAICELGDLLLSGTKDCYAASAVVRMVKHLLTKPAAVEALKEAHETSWEWVLGKRAPRNTYVDFAVPDDAVVEKSVTAPGYLDCSDMNAAMDWTKLRERPKRADGRARWRMSVVGKNSTMPVLRLIRMIRGAYIAAKAAPQRGQSILVGAYPAWKSTK